LYNNSEENVATQGDESTVPPSFYNSPTKKKKQKPNKAIITSGAANTALEAADNVNHTQSSLSPSSPKK
jgi:hypothetical protein